MLCYTIMQRWITKQALGPRSVGGSLHGSRPLNCCSHLRFFFSSSDRSGVALSEGCCPWLQTQPAQLELCEQDWEKDCCLAVPETEKWQQNGASFEWDQCSCVRCCTFTYRNQISWIGFFFIHVKNVTLTAPYIHYCSFLADVSRMKWLTTDWLGQNYNALTQIMNATWMHFYFLIAYFLLWLAHTGIGITVKIGLQ